MDISDEWVTPLNSPVSRGQRRSRSRSRTTTPSSTPRRSKRLWDGLEPYSSCVPLFELDESSPVKTSSSGGHAAHSADCSPISRRRGSRISTANSTPAKRMGSKNPPLLMADCPDEFFYPCDSFGLPIAPKEATKRKNSEVDMDAMDHKMCSMNIGHASSFAADEATSPKRNKFDLGLSLPQLTPRSILKPGAHGTVDSPFPVGSPSPNRVRFRSPLHHSSLPPTVEAEQGGGRTPRRMMIARRRSGIAPVPMAVLDIEDED